MFSRLFAEARSFRIFFKERTVEKAGKDDLPVDVIRMPNVRVRMEVGGGRVEPQLQQRQRGGT